MELDTLLLYWGGFILSNILLGAGVMMILKGTLPPPMSRVKVGPKVGTGVLVVGLTLMLVFGTPSLLKNTIDFFAA